MTETTTPDTDFDQAAGGEPSTAQTLRDKAGDLREKASSLIQDGVDYVKNNPGTTAAVVGGVAATAAAAVAGTVYRDKIAAAVKGDSKPGPKGKSGKA